LTDAELLIVGGGPAGMNAALAAASKGVSCCIIDEAAELGGQIYRTAHPTARQASPQLIHPRGDELRAQVEQQSELIEVRSKSVVWGVSDVNKVAVGREAHGTEFLHPKAMVIATGAYEFCPPFPGWTLPGVMTPGSAQILAKTMNVLPGQRVLVAGTGPLLYVVASNLVQKGADVVAVLEATQKIDWLRLPLVGWSAPELLAEGLEYLRVLREAGVPVHYGRVVTRAEGDGEVQSVCHAPVNRNWFPDRSREERIEVDTLCIGYGLQPRNYLAQLSGCAIEFDALKGGWTPQRDKFMRTSQNYLYAVGDGAGIGGSRIAELDGKLVGLTAASDLGYISAAEMQKAQRPLRARRTRFARVQNAIARITRLRPGLAALVEPDTIVCRCEEIRWREAKTAIEHGGHDFRTLKVMTRIGMGMCQARFCWPAMANMVAQQTGKAVVDIGPAKPRPPIRPVQLDVIAKAPAAKVEASE
jgi:NADPH-dependent 2,4-dienoyl-CoA reductase/sulfur reductase-like enzyme